ncbi:MAG: hypothetical protein BA863_10350 [Desulfovibrio sp. S3730MH75]|nr:MAG: hypothetical protein BA863_10350 [Desulfovibrio sp. S3730MH75]
MPRFRKKPIEVDAHQWFKNGDHPEDNLHGLLRADDDGVGHEPEGKVVRYYRDPDDEGGERLCERCGVRMHEHGWIDTLEGGRIVCPGDWIITGVVGDRYPCKKDAFQATYSSVEELPEGFIAPFEQEGELWNDLRVLIGKGAEFDAVRQMIEHRLEIVKNG